MVFGVPYIQTNPYVYLYLYKWETAWYTISVVITATTPSGLYTSFAMNCYDPSVNCPPREGWLYWKEYFLTQNGNSFLKIKFMIPFIHIMSYHFISFHVTLYSFIPYWGSDNLNFGQIGVLRQGAPEMAWLGSLTEVLMGMLHGHSDFFAACFLLPGKVLDKSMTDWQWPFCQRWCGEQTPRGGFQIFEKWLARNGPERCRKP